MQPTRFPSPWPSVSTQPRRRRSTQLGEFTSGHRSPCRFGTTTAGILQHRAGRILVGCREKELACSRRRSSKRQKCYGGSFNDRVAGVGAEGRGVHQTPPTSTAIAKSWAKRCSTPRDSIPPPQFKASVLLYVATPLSLAGFLEIAGG